MQYTPYILHVLCTQKSPKHPTLLYSLYVHIPYIRKFWKSPMCTTYPMYPCRLFCLFVRLCLLYAVSILVIGASSLTLRQLEACLQRDRNLDLKSYPKAHDREKKICATCARRRHQVYLLHVGRRTNRSANKPRSLTQDPRGSDGDTRSRSAELPQRALEQEDVRRTTSTGRISQYSSGSPVTLKYTQGRSY